MPNTAAALNYASDRLEQTVGLLGGPKVLKCKVKSAFDAHALLSAGLPDRSLLFLVNHFVVLDPVESLQNLVGVSFRTLQRKKENADGLLDRGQSDRAWRFAELLANAINVFGTREDAEKWLQQPAIGLNGQRPIDLLPTAAGFEMVDKHLRQLEYGVYV